MKLSLNTSWSFRRDEREKNATDSDILQLQDYHPIIGLVLFSLLALQPVTQLLNHFFYARFPRILYLGHAHKWLGRLLLTVGIINGGLGFQFASTLPGPQWPRAPKIAYGACATVVWIVYLGVLIVFVELRRAPRPALGAGEEMIRLSEPGERGDEEAPATTAHVESVGMAAESGGDIPADQDGGKVLRSSDL